MGSSKSKETPQEQTKEAPANKPAPTTTQQQKKQPKENQWIYDYILQYLASPLWRIPIYEFLDENCIVFDDEEENKFAYYDLHKKFKDMIEAMIEQLMIDIGIEEEQLREVVEGGLKHQKHRKYFEQLLIVDNFLVFKKLMLKRNKELELEALKELEKLEGGGNDTDIKARIQNAELEKEKAEIEHAIAMSLAIEQERQKLLDEEDEQLQEAIRMSAIMEQPLSTQEGKQETNFDEQDQEQNNQLEENFNVQPEEAKQESDKLPPLVQLPPIVPIVQSDQQQQQPQEEAKEKPKKKITKKVTKKPEEQKEQKEKQPPQPKLAPINVLKEDEVQMELQQTLLFQAPKISQTQINKEREQLKEQINKLKQQQQDIVSNIKSLKYQSQQQGQEQKVESLDDRKKRLQQQRELIRKKKQLEREAELNSYNKDPNQQQQAQQSEIKGNDPLALDMVSQLQLIFTSQSEFIQQQQQAQVDQTKKEELRKKQELMKKIRENIAND